MGHQPFRLDMYILVHGLLHDIEQKFHKYQGMDQYIWIQHMIKHFHNLDLNHIHVCTLGSDQMDLLQNLVHKNKQLHHFFRDIQHWDHKVTVGKELMASPSL